MVHYFACNTDATYLDDVETFQVTRLTISRNVTRLVEERRFVREGKHLIVVSNQGVR